MGKIRQPRYIAIALAAATPNLLAVAPAVASAQPPRTASAEIAPAAAEVSEAQARLLSGLISMTPAEKGALASDRIPKADLIVVAAKNTAANCSNPCRKTKLLCPHKTTVPGGCPSTVTKHPKRV